jgi:uncharacterized protein YodC (DUF2158 family)
MGVRRYSQNPVSARREKLFDHLQNRCRWYDGLVVEELRRAGIQKAEWACRECWHTGKEFTIWSLPPKARVQDLRRGLYCCKCAAKRPYLKLSTEGYG